MRWLDIFRRESVRDPIGYRIDASAFPVVVYHNTRDPILFGGEFWDKLPNVGDRHRYRDDMFVASIEYDEWKATVVYEQGSRVMLPTMEVVWQLPS